MWLLVAAAIAGAPKLDPIVLLTQGSAVCAGTIVDDTGRVLTAYHCVARGGRLGVETVDGYRAVGRVVAVSRRRDLALVDAPSLAGRPSLRVAAPSDRGSAVWVVGHPFGGAVPTGFFAGLLRWSTSRGEISAVGPEAIQFTAPVNPGNSGGPVIDAGSGDVVGVVSRRRGRDGVAFAGRVDALDAMKEGLPLLGGTIDLTPFLSTWGDAVGAVAVGARLEVVARRRLALGAGMSLPIGGRWDVARFDEVRWAEAELYGALRQPLGRGPLAGTLGVAGGIASVVTLTADDDVVFRRGAVVAPTVGGEIGVAGVLLRGDAVWFDGRPILRAVVGFGWPGAVAYW